MKIALIHALGHSIPPIESAFASVWPEASLMNLLDDSLSKDREKDAALRPVMTERFLTLGRYAAGIGVDAILFTCSAFGPCIEAVARELAPLPVLKPNEAMIEEATAQGGKIGLLVTFWPTAGSMLREFAAGSDVEPRVAEGALAALDRGDGDEHDRLVATEAKKFTQCDLIVLGQFSLARARDVVAGSTGLPVLTTPDSAVKKLKTILTGLDTTQT